MSWVPGGLVTNPSADQVLVTSPMLASGSYAVTAYVACSVALSAFLQHVRGASVLESVLLIVYAPSLLFPAPVPLVVQAGDIIRVTTRNDVVGEVQAVLFLSP